MLTAKHGRSWTPLLMGVQDAAHYLGISATTLRGLGLPRRVLGARKLYDIRDLDAFADALPYESEGGAGRKNTCDVVCGIS